MGCRNVELENGARAIVCGRTKRCACGRAASRLCDGTDPQRKSGTCDTAMCEKCTYSPAPEKDFCPKHAGQWDVGQITKDTPPPEIREHDGVQVVRDDLFPGGTKARFMPLLYGGAEEIVYPSPCEGGAQTALAETARRLGKRATIFVAKREKPHPRTIMAKRLGARVFQVTPGYLNVVRARAKEYCDDKGATLAPFGFDTPQIVDAVAEAARQIDIRPDQVWCAAGSGVLMRGLAKAFPDAERIAVQIGRELKAEDVAGAKIAVGPWKFSEECDEAQRPPFPSDLHYDAKAWALMRHLGTSGTALFWNVTGPPA